MTTILVMLLVVPAAAGDYLPYREWRDSSGRFSCIARLEQTSPTAVRIRRFDTDALVEVPLSRLSREDLWYLVELEQAALERQRAVRAEYSQMVANSRGGAGDARRARIEARRQAERQAAYRGLQWQYNVAAAYHWQQGRAIAGSLNYWSSRSWAPSR